MVELFQKDMVKIFIIFLNLFKKKKQDEQEDSDKNEEEEKEENTHD